MPSAAVRSSPLCFRAGRFLSSARLAREPGKHLGFLPIPFRWEPQVNRKIRSAPKHSREDEIAVYHVSISIFLTVDWSKKCCNYSEITEVAKWEADVSSVVKPPPKPALLRSAQTCLLLLISLMWTLQTWQPWTISHIVWEKVGDLARTLMRITASIKWMSPLLDISISAFGNML